MEDLSMITKDYFEKQLKKHDKITVYSQDGIPFTIRKAPYIERDTINNRLTFEMDCVDFELYCKNMYLSLTPVSAN